MNRSAPWISPGRPSWHRMMRQRIAIVADLPTLRSWSRNLRSRRRARSVMMSSSVFLIPWRHWVVWRICSTILTHIVMTWRLGQVNSGCAAIWRVTDGRVRPVRRVRSVPVRDGAAGVGRHARVMTWSIVNILLHFKTTWNALRTRIDWLARQLKALLQRQLSLESARFESLQQKFYFCQAIEEKGQMSEYECSLHANMLAILVYRKAPSIGGKLDLNICLIITLNNR